MKDVNRGFVRMLFCFVLSITGLAPVGAVTWQPYATSPNTASLSSVTVNGNSLQVNYQLGTNSQSASIAWYCNNSTIDWSSSDSVTFDVQGDGSANALTIILYDSTDNSYLETQRISLAPVGSQHVIVPFSELYDDLWNGSAFNFRRVGSTIVYVEGHDTNQHTITVSNINPWKSAVAFTPASGYPPALGAHSISTWVSIIRSQ